MDSKDEIDITMFRDWEKNPVTIRLREVLKEWDDSMVDTMLNSNVILNEQGRDRYSMCTGQRELLNILLSLSVEDLQQPKEDETYVIRDDNERKDDA